MFEWPQGREYEREAVLGDQVESVARAARHYASGRLPLHSVNTQLDFLEESQL